MDALSIIGLAGQGAKTIVGGIQGLVGRKQQRDLWKNRPQLGITDGEKANDSLYGQMASLTEAPGERRAIQRMDEAVSGGIYDAQRTANSSLGATQAAVDLNMKKMDAIKDLAGSFSEFKQQQKERLASWNTEKIGLEQERFQVNKMLPWEIKMNEAVDRKTKGFEGMFKGIDSGLGMLGDIAGTKQMMEFYKEFYGK